MRVLSPEDKEFIKKYDKGVKPSTAFRESYPEHPVVVGWKNSEPGSPDNQIYRDKLKQAAKYKLQAQYIQNALTTYQDSMEEFSQESVKTAIDLVKNARSEKVRADLAIEGMRHKVGTPVQKMAIQEETTVTLKFERPDVIDVPNETDDT